MMFEAITEKEQRKGGWRAEAGMPDDAAIPGKSVP
jgi:hypothetical protein